MPGEVFMLDGPFEDVGHCFLPSMRMIWEACTTTSAHMIKHEEWREVAHVGSADGAPNCGANTLGFLGGSENLADCS